MSWWKLFQYASPKIVSRTEAGMDVNTELAPFRCALMHVIWSMPKNLNDQKATVIAYFLNLTPKEFGPVFYIHQCLMVFMNVFINAFINTV